MRSDRFRAVLLALILAIGAGVAWGFAAGWTLTTLDQVLFGSPKVWEQLVVHSGTPLIRSYTGRAYQDMTYRTLDGKRVEVASGRNVEGADVLTRPASRKDWFARLPWSERITPINRYSYSTDAWYLVHDGELDGHAYLVGYDKPTRRTIGYIGRQGFQAEMPAPADQFPIAGPRYRFSRFGSSNGIGSSDVCLLTDEGIVLVDLGARTAKLLWKHANPLAFTFLGGGVSSPGGPKWRIAVRTPDQVRVLDIKGNEEETFTLPAELRKTFQLQWVPLSKGKSLACASDGDELFWLDTSGATRRQKVALHRPEPESAQRRAVLASLIAPVPAGFTAVIDLTALWLSDDSLSGRYWSRLGKVLGETWPGVVVAWAIGAAAAWLCYRRQRRYGMPWTPAWTVLTLLLGMPFYFGYLAHRQWPARLACPSCGRPVPRDRQACIACHRDFPAPALKGIEVFA